MPTSSTSLSDAATAMVLVAMFVIVLVVARGALKEVPLFGGAGSWPVAFCTAALSVLGFLRFLGPPDQSARTEGTSSGTGGGIDFILLPYVALAISILLVLLLRALAARRPRRYGAIWEQEQVRPAPRTKTLVRKRQPAPQTSLRKRSEK